MKRLLQLGLVVGFVGTLAAAWFAPIFEYTRYRSATSVVANVGRVEQFLVHLPADRIDTTVGAETFGVSGPRLQHFKLRDSEGNVIGLAARHELVLGGTTETAWLLTIPSRGTIALAASGDGVGTIESALAAEGLAAGGPVDLEVSIDTARTARSVAATGEFSDIDIEMIETWVISGVNEDGELRGTLQLNTIGRRTT